MAKKTVIKRTVLDKLSSQAWRLNNLYWIEDKNGKKVRLRLSWAQKLLMKNKHFLNNILKVRQLGISTLIAIYILDSSMFRDGIKSGIIDVTAPDATKKLKKIEFAWKNLDCEDDGNKELIEIGKLVKQKTGVLKKDGTIELVKSNDSEIFFSTGSEIYAATSLRGGTLQILHISELGRIAFETPKKSAEIRSGALNAVAQGGEIFSESTHEGGQHGDNYELIAMAMENQKKEVLSPMDWKFHFYSWYQQPEYVLNPEFASFTDEDIKYFYKVENEYGIQLSEDRKAWYASKAKEQGLSMLKEYPTVAEEALSSRIEGSIYGSIIGTLRAKGHIRDFHHEEQLPFYTSWDLGFADSTAIWLAQFVGRELLLLDCFENNQEGAAFYVNQIRKWEDQFRMVVANNFLPHDAGAATRGSGRPYVSYLNDAGLHRIQIVPRTPDTWIGINATRDLLKKSIIHARCGVRLSEGGVEKLSPIEKLSEYRTKKSKEGATVTESPLHDHTSHVCDALRTLSEAHSLGLVVDANAMRRKPVVLTGCRGAELGRGRVGVRVRR